MTPTPNETPEQLRIETEIIAKLMREQNDGGWQFSLSVEEVPEEIGHYGLHDGLRGLGGGVTYNMRDSLERSSNGHAPLSRPIFSWLPDMDGSAALWLDNKVRCSLCEHDPTPDRNKTQTTREITAAVVTWLDYHGFKPIETEVTVTRGWQADIAGVIDCTEGEAIALHLAPRKPNWRMSDERYRIMRAGFEAAYKALPSPVTALIEVKTSVSDLKSDAKWKRSLSTDLSFAALPPGLLTLGLSLIPSPWGILTVTERGVRVQRWATLASGTTLEMRFQTLYDIALRRDHRTRHAALRESQKAARVVNNQERVTPERYSKIANLFIRIAEGETRFCPTLEQTLASSQINLPNYIVEQLKPLWGILANGNGKHD